MRPMTRATILLACSLCFLTGWLVRDRAPAGLRADPTPPKKVDAPAFPMAARLGANLYLQTSAEYRACCLGIYRAAELRLEALLERARPKWERPAVVMDLDETVLDNSAFQTFLYRQRLEYTDELWADHEANYPQDVTLIPGAKSFINKASGLGVTVLYISNRSELYRKATESALARLGVPAVSGDRLYLKPEGRGSDKAARREAAAATTS
jgi:5'-nucleotidase (lipoprotein e(P4) family)